MFWIDKVEEEKLIRIIKFLFLSYFKKIEKKIIVFIEKIGERRNLVNPLGVTTTTKLNFIAAIWCNYNF